MVEKAHLEQLAAHLQQAVAEYDADDKTAWLRIDSAMEKLRRAAEPPEMFILRQRLHLALAKTVENICILIAIELGLFKLLASSQAEPVTAACMAKVSRYDEFFIARVMRVITAIGLADEVGRRSYLANPHTICQSDQGSAGGLILSNEIVFPLASKMRTFLRQKKPCNIRETPPAYDFAMGETLWETFEMNEEWKEGFDSNMTARNKMLSIPWHKKYPIRERLAFRPANDPSLPAKPIIVDVGGNLGIDLQRLVDSFPGLDCELILQDLPETLMGVSDSLDPMIKPTPYDFFTEQIVKGADVYYLKSVLHLWDNVASQKILSNTARVMKPHSRLLVNEMVLAEINESRDRVDMDMLMMFLSNGMERTRIQWEKLLSQAEPPLKILEIWSVPGDQQSVIEACLA